MSLRLTAQELNKNYNDYSEYGLLQNVLKDTFLEIYKSDRNYVEQHNSYNKTKDDERNILKKTGLLEQIAANTARAADDYTDGSTNVYAGFGVFVPVSDYGKIYKKSQAHSIFADFEKYSVNGFIPEIIVKYSSLLSSDRPGKVYSSFSLFQVSVGLIYPFKTGLIINKNPVTIYSRITDGITRISFEHETKNGQIIEYVHTLEISGGVMYSFYSNFITGIDFGYRYIATKNAPLQSLNFSIFAGVKI